jgi:hypothetical protein
MEGCQKEALNRGLDPPRHSVSEGDWIYSTGGGLDWNDGHPACALVPRSHSRVRVWPPLARCVHSPRPPHRTPELTRACIAARDSQRTAVHCRSHRGTCSARKDRRATTRLREPIPAATRRVARHSHHPHTHTGRDPAPRCLVCSRRPAPPPRRSRNPRSRRLVRPSLPPSPTLLSLRLLCTHADSQHRYTQPAKLFTTLARHLDQVDHLCRLVPPRPLVPLSLVPLLFRPLRLVGQRVPRQRTALVRSRLAQGEVRRRFGSSRLVPRRRDLLCRLRLARPVLPLPLALGQRQRLAFGRRRNPFPFPTEFSLGRPKGSLPVPGALNESRRRGSPRLALPRRRRTSPAPTLVHDEVGALVRLFHHARLVAPRPPLGAVAPPPRQREHEHGRQSAAGSAPLAESDVPLPPSPGIRSVIDAFDTRRRRRRRLGVGVDGGGRFHERLLGRRGGEWSRSCDESRVRESETARPAPVRDGFADHHDRQLPAVVPSGTSFRRRTGHLPRQHHLCAVAPTCQRQRQRWWWRRRRDAAIATEFTCSKSLPPRGALVRVRRSFDDQPIRQQQ